MAYGVVDPNIANMNPADRNNAARAAGYTGWDDYQNNKATTQPSYRSSTVSSGSGASWEDTVKKAIDMQKAANAPAIASYQAQIPEIQSAYAAQTANITAKQQTLKDRYDNLLKSIGAQKTQDINKQTLVTSNELGKRGLLPSSTLAQQEVLNATQPIGERYAGLETTAALDQTTGQQELQSLLNQLTSGETSDKRAILNAIAQLESGAGSTGISTGTNVWQNLQAQKAEADRIASEQAWREKVYNETTLPESQAKIASSTTPAIDGNISKLLSSIIGGGSSSNIEPKPTTAPNQVKPTASFQKQTQSFAQPSNPWSNPVKTWAN